MVDVRTEADLFRRARNLLRRSRREPPTLSLPFVPTPLGVAQAEGSTALLLRIYATSARDSEYRRTTVAYTLQDTLEFVSQQIGADPWLQSMTKRRLKYLATRIATYMRSISDTPVKPGDVVRILMGYELSSRINQRIVSNLFKVSGLPLSSTDLSQVDSVGLMRLLIHILNLGIGKGKKIKVRTSLGMLTYSPNTDSVRIFPSGDYVSRVSELLEELRDKSQRKVAGGVDYTANITYYDITNNDTVKRDLNKHAVVLGKILSNYFYMLISKKHRTIRKQVRDAVVGAIEDIASEYNDAVLHSAIVGVTNASR